jgi:murein DD-endopeptidase MepM/ murein hydrolase activator NlpD
MIELDSLLAAAGDVGRLLVVQSLLVLATGVVVLVLDRTLKRFGPGCRLALWALVFVRILLPPDFGAGWSPIAIAREAVPDAAYEAAAVPLGMASHPPSTHPIRVERPTHSAGFSMLYRWLTGIWLAGAGWSLVRVARRRRRASAVARAARPAPPRLAAVSERWRNQWKVRRAVPMLVSDDAVGPFTVGTLRPVIVLPVAVVRRPEVVEAAVAHEMAHVARFDDLQLVLQQVLGALCFFHPMVWWAGRRMETERELCTDAKVLAAATIAPRPYALALLDAAGLGLRAGPQPALFDHSRRVAMRIENIIAFSPRARRSAVKTALVVVAAAALALPLTAASVGVPPTQAPPDAAAPAPEPPSEPETPMPAPASPASPAAPVPPLAEPVPEGRLTMGWGEHRHPMTGRMVHHRGTDLAAPAGTPVLAVADGVVSTVLVDFGDAASGRYVVVDHGSGLTTYYGHVDQVLVEREEQVERGQQIATVGSTGVSTGPHLHFEVRIDGEAIDPADVMGEAQ